MNIKIKAALEVTATVVVAILAVGLVRSGLDALTELYGNEIVLRGVTLALLGMAAYFILRLAYDLRLDQLQREERLKELRKG